MATLEERLAEYEELFADRYTEKDECYQEHISVAASLPPVITEWTTPHNYQDRKRGDNQRQGGRDRGWDSRHGGDRDRKDRYDRHDNRGYGGNRQDYRERGPRDDRNTQYKSSGYYQMYY